MTEQTGTGRQFKPMPAVLKARLQRRYPTVADLRLGARRRVPHFAFEFMDGGAGGDGCITRNWASLDAIELVPRYGKTIVPPPTDITLFGRAYSSPIGIAPMGGPGVAFPGADMALATAAQYARVPYVLSLVAGLSIERAAEVAPDVLWFQLIRCSGNDHAIGFDLVARADAVGAHVLVLTMDTPPVWATRPRAIKSGFNSPFRLTPRLALDALTAPAWLLAMAEHGAPSMASFAKYVRPGANVMETARFVASENKGAFTWDEVARYRDRWKKPLVLKGILNPEDADKAVSLGVDGIVVSNHGGRQVEALPSAIGALPGIVTQVAGRTTVLFDSGVRSGDDIARALALGAEAALAGKAFLWGLGALGARGPEHVIDILAGQFRATLGQLGCANPGELRGVVTRRHLPDFVTSVMAGRSR